MDYILTLVSSKKNMPLTDKHLKEIAYIIESYNLKFTSKVVWLNKNKAAEVTISNNAQSSLITHLREILEKDKIDFFITKNKNRIKKLILADMDSTIAQGETLDELAKYAGIKDKISEITMRAMEGELNFHEALRERVFLLKGLESTALNATLTETETNQGAEVFIKTMRNNGATCVLISGGFTFFTKAIAKQCGFNFNHGNTLEIKNNKLTGKVIPPILDKYAKVEYLEKYIKELDISTSDCLTIGDGANDLPMLKMVDLGIGYRPKDTVKSNINNCILYGDLTTALYAQGIPSIYFKNFKD